MVAESETRGIASPVPIRSPTVTSCAPSLPPGWKAWKSRAEKPLASISAMARASPKASCMVVEVVGARRLGQASSAAGRANGRLAALIRALFGPAATATRVTPKRLQ